jgi:phosphoribosylformylglycinamidine synthase
MTACWWCTIASSAMIRCTCRSNPCSAIRRACAAWRTACRRCGATGLRNVELREAVYRVLRLPAVADKTFLITIGDRTVGGQISRDQLVGPWQVPVADVAVTLADYHHHAGEAMAIGERTPAALLDAAAAARLAVTEAITNILAADIAP